jgi:hypothetical protein
MVSVDGLRWPSKTGEKSWKKKHVNTHQIANQSFAARLNVLPTASICQLSMILKIGVKILVRLWRTQFGALGFTPRPNKARMVLAAVRFGGALSLLQYARVVGSVAVPTALLRR